MGRLDRELIVTNMYKGGCSIYKIGNELDMQRDTVVTILIKHGLFNESNHRGKCKLLTDKLIEEYDHIKKLLDDGNSITTIAKEYGTSFNTVKDVIYIMGDIEICDKETEEKILQLYINGEQTSKIYRGLNIPTHLVESVIKKYRYLNNINEQYNKELEERNKTIVELYNNGVNKHDISEACNVSVITVNKVLRYKLNRIDKSDGELKKEIISMYNKGISRKDIISTLGCSASYAHTICSILDEKNGVTRGVDKKTRKNIIELRLKGIKLIEISEKLGISVYIINKVIDKAIDEEKDIEVAKVLASGNLKLPSCDKIANTIRKKSLEGNIKEDTRARLNALIKIASKIKLMDEEELQSIKDKINSNIKTA